MVFLTGRSCMQDRLINGWQSTAFPGTYTKIAAEKHVDDVFGFVGNFQRKSLSDHTVPRGAAFFVQSFFYLFRCCLKVSNVKWLFELLVAEHYLVIGRKLFTRCNDYFNALTFGFFT